MQELKKQIEAILFSVARYIGIEEISELCHEDQKKVKEALLELKVEFENSEGSSLVFLNDGEKWKLTTREEYSKIVRKIVTQTELSKTLLETLAVIAFKYPIKQSDLIKIRTNKAYDHLSELEEQGFITRVKYGRSRLIKLTDKFFDYFDLPRDKLKERFKGFEQLATSIEAKEEDNEKLKIQQTEILEEVKKQEEAERMVQDGQVEIIDEDTTENNHEDDIETYSDGDNINNKSTNENDSDSDKDKKIENNESNTSRDDKDNNDGDNVSDETEEENGSTEDSSNDKESMKDKIDKVLGK